VTQIIIFNQIPRKEKMNTLSKQILMACLIAGTAIATLTNSYVGLSSLGSD